MGVDHGRTGGTSPPPRIWSGGTLIQIVLPQILSYRYKNERSVAFKIRQNPFTAGAPPRTPLGELTTLPQTPYSRLERGHPSPYATPLDTDPPSALAMRPPRSPARSTPMTPPHIRAAIDNCSLLLSGRSHGTGSVLFQLDSVKSDSLSGSYNEGAVVLPP